MPFYSNALASRVGQRVSFQESNAEAEARQWSDELQINYSSEKLQLTVGAIYYHSKEETGAPLGQRNNLGLLVFTPASGLIPLGGKGRSYNEATSLAAYAQMEYKITPELEIVGGARITKDKKDFTLDYNVVSATGVVSARAPIVAKTYKDTNPNFMVGINWTPNDDVLVYGKYSTSFVSGGSTIGIGYDPEKVKSFELGIKADLLDSKLRTNLAVFKADYNHYQASNSGILPSGAAIALPIFSALYNVSTGYLATTATELLSAAGTFINDQGKLAAKGFELEVTALPFRGLTLGTGVGYTDTKFSDIPALILAGNGGRLDPSSRAKWTASMYGIYETEPMFGDATLQFRLDGQYRSSVKITNNPVTALYGDGSNAAAIAPIKGYTVMNGRIALRHLQLAGADAELAVWGKNLADNKSRATGLALGPIATTAFYIPARTYGLDLSIDF